MSGFFSGSFEPFMPHVVLLSIAAIASFAVAGGIVLENPKWSLANMLVVGGVAIEAICTFLLFGFDEGISGKQQSLIVKQQSQILAALSELCDQDNSLIGNPVCIEYRKQKSEQAAKKKTTQKP